ncbi:extracellular solute-binding protein [Micromonospora costi]|uniref:extracellular solute-binding protein n=1 Tax=Micromonospora costi TaxID=1530042 RepID=UPI0033CCD552
MSEPDPLVVVGREFDGFHRSLTTQLATLSDLPARYELVEISELQSRLIDGDAATSGAYDVLMVVTDWLPSLIESGKVLPLDGHLTSAAPDGWPDQWVPALRELQTGADGRTYGVAYHDGPMLFIYRTDLYGDPAEQAGFAERFGYPLAVPETWDQYRDQAIWFTRPERGLYGTVLAGFPDEHNNVYDFLMHLWSRGGELVTAEGRSGLDSDSARAAIDFIDDLWHRSRVVDPAAAGWDSVESGVRFAAGAGAMMVNWCGFASLSAAPDSPTHGLVGCAPVPGAASRVTMNAYWVLAVPAGAKDPARSYELIRRLTTKEMDVVTAQSGGSATRLDSWADPRVSALAPYYGVLADAHRDSRSVPVDPRWPEMALILNDMMIGVIEQRAGHAALAEAHERLGTLLDKGL